MPAKPGTDALGTATPAVPWQLAQVAASARVFNACAFCASAGPAHSASRAASAGRSNERCIDNFVSSLVNRSVSDRVDLTADPDACA
jgi:hypothetical protein